MTKHVKVERKIGKHDFFIETGRLARQAAGATFVGYGDNRVLVAASHGNPRPDMGYFPLMMDYREKMYAAGKFPGGFRKREGMPGKKEVLTSRLMDRPIRPMFPDGFMDEMIVQAVVLSSDKMIDTDILAMNGASAALVASPVPFTQPVASVRIGIEDDEFVVNPNHNQIDTGGMDLVVSGTKTAITMVEAGMNELPEEKVIEAIFFAHEIIKTLCEMQEELAEKSGVVKEDFQAPEKPAIFDEVAGKYYSKIQEASVVPGKKNRQAAMEKVLDEMQTEYDPQEDDDEKRKDISEIFTDLEKKAVREQILKESKRSDGRGLDEIRNISIETGLLPRAHGSAVFTRGETQALVACTLGTGRDEQEVDGLRETYSEPFILHYNFPGFSVGEAKPPRGPSRREIGHGALAQRALEPLLPIKGPEFAYAIRLVSEVLESNGSSSQATVCAGSLALMDAGVPLKKSVAGIAMGMIHENAETRILSDILGSEDHCGDMDFKVAGTRDGITALQMDIKMEGLDPDVMKKALAQANEGRMHILEKMEQVISKPRESLSEYAPRLISIKVDPEKIGAIIGKGGSVVRSIQEDYECTVEIEDDGTVTIASVGDGGEQAQQKILDLVAEAEVGKIYEGPVVSTTDFGAFVKILPEQDGMVHISELADGYVNKIEDVCKKGDTLRVKCINVDDNGRVKLSRKELIKEEGESFKDGASGQYSLGGSPKEDRDSGSGRSSDRGGKRGGRGRGDRRNR